MTPLSRTLELHVIQTYPPGRMNRGQDNAPKMIVMGGVPRERVSSQSIKRAQRTRFPAGGSQAWRTKWPHTLILRRLPETAHLTHGEVLQSLVMDVMRARYGEYDDRGRLKASAFLGDDEVERFAALIGAHLGTLGRRHGERVAAARDVEGGKRRGAAESVTSAEAAYQAAVDEVSAGFTPRTDSADIALYGRFVAEEEGWNVEAASSYGHAISVGGAQVVPDFFSTVDDETGEVGHIGTNDHAAPTLYRFATLDLGQLERNLGRTGVEDVVRTWVTGFMHASPSGGGHGAFSHTLPDHVLIVARRGGHPVTLANAFSEPVYAGGGVSLLQASVGRLHERYAAQRRLFGENGETRAQAVGTVRWEDAAGVERGEAGIREAVDDLLRFVGP